MKEALQTQKKTPTASSITPARAGRLQRKCACGGSAGLKQDCEGCSKQSLNLQRSTENPELETRNSKLETGYAGVPPIVHEVLGSAGQPLDAATRAFMEPRFNHDFSHVRVHTDEKAAQSARAVNALAYTVGSHITMRADKHSPGTESGRRLLAHELAHVVQQARGIVGSDPESRADLASQKTMAGEQVTSEIVGTAPAGLYRQGDDEEEKEEVVTDDDDDELIKHVRSHFGQPQPKKSLFPPILPTSPLHPQWKPTHGIIDMRNREKPTPAPNLDWLAQTVSPGSGKKPVPAGFNPYDPKVDQKVYEQLYNWKQIKSGTSPTSLDMFKDQLIKGATATLGNFASPLKNKGRQEGERVLRRIKHRIPWHWLRRLIPGEEINDAYSADADSPKEDPSFLKRLRECLSARKKKKPEQTDEE